MKDSTQKEACKRERRKRFGFAFMAIGALALVAALALFGYNAAQDLRAKSAIDKALGELNAQAQQDVALEDWTLTQLVEGIRYFAILEVPSVDIELPVAYDYNDNDLWVAIARYSGDVATENLVIAGHDMNSQFAALDGVNLGDEVILTSISGAKHTYRVASVETLPPTAIEDMTAGAFPLTLFTCTYSGADRLTIRCESSDAPAK